MLFIINSRSNLINGDDDSQGHHEVDVNPELSSFEFPVDPNEPIYCFCKQVAFGEMVACDNDEVRNN